MNTLIIMASPNTNGNTSTLVESFIKGVEGEITIIYPYKEDIKPCIDCRYCSNKKGKCSIKDSMEKVYSLIEKADNILIASPMYFASFPGPMKNIIDRTQVYWSTKDKQESEKKYKNGILFITAGSYWQDMFIPMEKMTKYVFSLIDTKLKYNLYIPNTDKRVVEENKEMLLKAEGIGRKLSLINHR